MNLALVSKGAAAPYFYFGREGRFARPMVAAAAAARHRHTGLWGACSKTRLDPDHQLHTAGGRYTPPKKAPACTSGYSPCLINHGGADYDCAGGSGNGPYYTKSGVTYAVTGSDPYGLDSNGTVRVVRAVAAAGAGVVVAAAGAAARVAPARRDTRRVSSTTAARTMTVLVAVATGRITRRPASPTVTGSDPYGLDSNGNGLGCE